MVEFESHQLSNGLIILAHRDQSTELATCNLIYGVGARDEDENLTGFAHLFEHLMFGGSRHIPNFDQPVQLAGGENNAFTNNDYTNYYITLPHQNIETAFWLESDRLLALDFSEQNLMTQKKVVIEEFQQRYLNQPYGDVWLHLRPLAYTHHPYRWPTIGRDIQHIEHAQLEQVKAFFYQHYCPGNAILSVAGKIQADHVFKMAEKWFGQIERIYKPLVKIPAEPKQQANRIKRIRRPVPQDEVYLAYHMGARISDDFYCGDLLSDVLSSGNSSRLMNELIKEREVLTDANAYITGDIDPGLFILSGKPRPGITVEETQQLLEEQIYRLSDEFISEREYHKTLNKVEANFAYGQTSILNKAMNLGFHELLGSAESINDQINRYKNTSREQLNQFAIDNLQPSNCSILHYCAE